MYLASRAQKTRHLLVRSAALLVRAHGVRDVSQALQVSRVREMRAFQMHAVVRVHDAERVAPPPRGPQQRGEQIEPSAVAVEALGILREPEVRRDRGDARVRFRETRGVASRARAAHVAHVRQTKLGDVQPLATHARAAGARPSRGMRESLCGAKRAISRALVESLRRRFRFLCVRVRVVRGLQQKSARRVVTRERLVERQEARRDVGAFVFVKTRFVRFGLDDVDALEVAHAHREARAARRRRAVSRESVSSRVRLLAHEQAGRSHAEHGVEALRYDVRFLRRDEKNGVGVFVAAFFRFFEPVGAVGFESFGARGEARERHEARAIAVLAETIFIRFDDSRRRALVRLQPHRLRAEERREPAIPRNRLNRASDAPREIEARPKIARDVVHADVARPARLERETHQNQRPVRVGLHGLDRRVDVTRRARGIHPAAPRGRPTSEPPRVHASAERRDAQKRAGVVHVHARHGAVRLVVRQRVARRAAGLARLDHARAAARPEHARATRAERERLRADVGSRGDRSRHLGGLLGRAEMLRDARWVVRESPDAFEPVPTVHVRLGVLVGPDEQRVAGDVGAENLPRAFPRLKRARRKRAHRALHEHLVAGEVRQAHAVAYLVRQTHAGQDVRGETRV